MSAEAERLAQNVRGRLAPKISPGRRSQGGRGAGTVLPPDRGLLTGRLLHRECRPPWAVRSGSPRQLSPAPRRGARRTSGDEAAASWAPSTSSRRRRSADRTPTSGRRCEGMRRHPLVERLGELTVHPTDAGTLNESATSTRFAGLSACRRTDRGQRQRLGDRSPRHLDLAPPRNATATKRSGSTAARGAAGYGRARRREWRGSVAWTM